MRVRDIGKCVVVIILVIIQMVSCARATSRSISSSQVSFHPDVRSPQAAEHKSRRPIMKPKESKEEMEKRRRIGSKPPSCERKCYGCEPCEAIQVVPTISSIPDLSQHYANYQPQAWKCHCASP